MANIYDLPYQDRIQYPLTNKVSQPNIEIKFGGGGRIVSRYGNQGADETVDIELKPLTITEIAALNNFFGQQDLIVQWTSPFTGNKLWKVKEQSVDHLRPGIGAGDLNWSMKFVLVSYYSAI